MCAQKGRHVCLCSGTQGNWGSGCLHCAYLPACGCAPSGALPCCSLPQHHAPISRSRHTSWHASQQSTPALIRPPTSLCFCLVASGSRPACCGHHPPTCIALAVPQLALAAAVALVEAKLRAGRCGDGQERRELGGKPCCCAGIPRQAPRCLKLPCARTCSNTSLHVSPPRPVGPASEPGCLAGCGPEHVSDRGREQPAACMTLWTQPHEAQPCNYQWCPPPCHHHPRTRSTHPPSRKQLHLRWGFSAWHHPSGPNSSSHGYMPQAVPCPSFVVLGWHHCGMGRPRLTGGLPAQWAGGTIGRGLDGVWGKG